MEANKVLPDEVDFLIRLTRIDRRIAAGEFDKDGFREKTAALLGINLAKEKWLSEWRSSKGEQYEQPRRWRGFIINEKVEPEFCYTSSESDIEQGLSSLQISKFTIRSGQNNQGREHGHSYIQRKHTNASVLKYDGGLRTLPHKRTLSIQERNSDSNWDYSMATYKHPKDDLSEEKKVPSIIFEKKISQQKYTREMLPRVRLDSFVKQKDRRNDDLHTRILNKIARNWRKKAKQRHRRKHSIKQTQRRLDKKKWINWLSHMQQRMDEDKILYKTCQSESGETLCREKPIELWRRKANIVRRLCGVCLTLRKYAVEAGLINNFVVSVSSRRLCVNAEDGDHTEELEWDLDNFRANKEIRVPRATVDILEKHPHLRSTKDIQVIARLMRSLPSFRKYTNEMQLMMCRIVRYMKCTSRRVVLRKGHLGFSVYFIVTGSVSVVMDRDDQSVFVKPEVVILRKGACFGEIALLQNTRRNATIVCADDCEFLVIDKEDFIQNGLSERLDEEFSFRYNFYRSWNPLETWPDDNVRTLAYCSRTEDYSYNKVITTAKTKNEFLWFVVQGSCDLLKLVDLRNSPEYNTLQTLPSGVSRYTSAPTDNKTMQKKRAQSAPLKPKNNQQRRIKSAYFLSATKQLKDFRHKDMSSQASLSTSTIDSKSLDRFQSTETINTNSSLEFPLQKETNKSQVKHCKGDHTASIYVQVDQLRDGQCFGLEQLNADALDNRYTLVSKGCVIIHVPRRKFQELADESSLLKIKNIVKDYPNDPELVESFFQRRIWDNYKQNIVEEVIIDRITNKQKGLDTGLRNDKLEEYLKHVDMKNTYGTMLNEGETARTKQKLKNVLDCHSDRSPRTMSTNKNSNNKISKPLLFSPRLLSRQECSMRMACKSNHTHYFKSVSGSSHLGKGNQLKSKSTIITGRYEGASLRMDTKIRQLKSQSTVLSSQHYLEGYQAKRSENHKYKMSSSLRNNINQSPLLKSQRII